MLQVDSGHISGMAVSQASEERLIKNNDIIVCERVLSGCGYQTGLSRIGQAD